MYGNPPPKEDFLGRSPVPASRLLRQAFEVVDLHLYGYFGKLVACFLDARIMTPLLVWVYDGAPDFLETSFCIALKELKMNYRSSGTLYSYGVDYRTLGWLRNLTQITQYGSMVGNKLSLQR